MAALTATSTDIQNTGSLNQYKFDFSSVDSGDTFDSGLSAVYGYWTNVTGGVGTVNSIGISVSSGVFTIEAEDQNKALSLYVQGEQS